jgi:hypothetical protein
MIEDKIAKAKALIQQREQIDRELSALFGLADAPKRGRPRKEHGHESSDDQVGAAIPLHRNPDAGAAS